MSDKKKTGTKLPKWMQWQAKTIKLEEIEMRKLISLLKVVKELLEFFFDC